MTFMLLHFTRKVDHISPSVKDVQHGSSHHFSSWSGSKLNQLQKQLMERGMTRIEFSRFDEVMFLAKGICQAKRHILP